MVSDVLFARLSGNEERVLCGVLDCGARIADIYRPTPYDIEEALEAGEEALPNLYFPPGWARREDGVWTLARYAMKRHRRGSTLKFRRAPHEPAVDGPIEMLPVRAKCSACGSINTLSEHALGGWSMTSLPWYPVKN